MRSPERRPNPGKACNSSPDRKSDKVGSLLIVTVSGLRPGLLRRIDGTIRDCGLLSLRKVKLLTESSLAFLIRSIEPGEKSAQSEDEQLLSVQLYRGADEEAAREVVKIQILAKICIELDCLNFPASMRDYSNGQHPHVVLRSSFFE